MNNPLVKRRLPIAIGAAVLLGLLLVIHAITILCCDDYFYIGFWRGGLKSFIQNNINHYHQINGRVLVHVLCQTVLALGRPVFAGVAIVTYAALCRLAPALFGQDKQKFTLWQLVVSWLIFALLFLLMSQEMVLGKAMLWISAWFNYIFPAFLLVATATFLRKAECRRFWFLLAGLLLCFLSGATTEQSGCVAMVLFGCFWLEGVILKRKPMWGRLGFVLAALAGYGTIFLSPATQNRAGRDLGLALVKNTFGRIAVNTVTLHRSLALIIAFCLISYFFSRCNPQAPKVNRLYLPLAVLLLLSAVLPSSLRLSAALLALLLLGMAASTVGWIFFSPYKTAGYYQLAIMVSLLLMPFTNNAAVRITLPFVFGLLLLAMWQGSQLALFYWPRGNKRRCVSMVITSVAGVLAGLAIFLPTLSAFWANNRIFTANHAIIKENPGSASLTLSAQYDPRCCIKLLMHDTFAQGYFRTYYHLESTQITFSPSAGQATASYLVYGSDADPVIARDGTLYASLRSVITACGEWFCREECDHADFTLNGRKYVFTDGWLFDGRHWQNCKDTSVIYNAHTYMSLEFMTDALGITFDLSQNPVACTPPAQSAGAA